MNAKYRALHEASVRINKSLDGRGIVSSPYKDADADNIYQMMVELVPVGAHVRATYVPDPAKPAKMVTREGTVIDHIQISFDEPNFHIYFVGTNTTSHFPGSVLEVL